MKFLNVKKQLTGRLRGRRSWTGKVILQCEELTLHSELSSMATPPTGCTDVTAWNKQYEESVERSWYVHKREWRDVTDKDLFERLQFVSDLSGTS